MERLRQQEEQLLQVRPALQMLPYHLFSFPIPIPIPIPELQNRPLLSICRYSILAFQLLIALVLIEGFYYDDSDI